VSSTLSTLTILGPQGDQTMTWDETDARSVEEVRREFDRLVKGARWWAYAYPATITDAVAGVADRATPEVIREFDPTAREILLAPQIAGG